MANESLIKKSEELKGYEKNQSGKVEIGFAMPEEQHKEFKAKKLKKDKLSIANIEVTKSKKIISPKIARSQQEKKDRSPLVSTSPADFKISEVSIADLEKLLIAKKEEQKLLEEQRRLEEERKAEERKKKKEKIKKERKKEQKQTNNLPLFQSSGNVPLVYDEAFSKMKRCPKCDKKLKKTWVKKVGLDIIQTFKCKKCGFIKEIKFTV